MYKTELLNLPSKNWSTKHIHVNSTITGVCSYLRYHREFEIWMAVQCMDFDANSQQKWFIYGIEETKCKIRSIFGVDRRTADKWILMAHANNFIYLHDKDDKISITPMKKLTRILMHRAIQTAADCKSIDKFKSNQIGDWTPKKGLLSNPIHNYVSFSQMCFPHLPGATRAELHEFTSLMTSHNAYSRCLLSKLVRRHRTTSMRYHMRTKTARKPRYLAYNLEQFTFQQEDLKTKTLFAEEVAKADAYMRLNADEMALTRDFGKNLMETCRPLKVIKSHDNTYVGHEIPSQVVSKYTPGAWQSESFMKKINKSDQEYRDNKTPDSLPPGIYSRNERLKKLMALMLGTKRHGDAITKVVNNKWLAAYTNQELDKGYEVYNGVGPDPEVYSPINVWYGKASTG